MAEVITDGRADVAKTSSLEVMRVEAVGRQTFQRVYLWTRSKDAGDDSGKGKKTTTNIKYEPDVDGPQLGGTHRLPEHEETTPHDDGKLYLEVGLAIGSEPERYVRKGVPRSKEREEEREARGVLDRDVSAMRVFMPETEYIPAQGKLYVGCRPTEGRLFPRVIEARCVFFYAEFWEGIADGTKARDRLSALISNCKLHAALNKTTADDATMALPGDGAVELTASNHPAIAAYYDFGRPFEAHDAELLKTEMQRINAKICDLDINIMMRVRRKLVDLRLGRKLSDSNLGMFLWFCNENIEAEDVGDIEDEVKRWLWAVMVANDCKETDGV